MQRGWKKEERIPNRSIKILFLLNIIHIYSADGSFGKGVLVGETYA